MGKLKALIFDCDGVLAETERDGHRVSFNTVFEEKGIQANWGVEEYAKLVTIAGGKERMISYFTEHPGIITTEQLNGEYIKELHKRKTEIFIDMSAKGKLPSRVGIKRIIKEAHDEGILLFVCSTSHKESVSELLKSNLGDEYFGWFTDLFCGDIVKNKKPAPDIYNLVKENYNLKGEECFVVEDSRIGLLAAKGEGMNCVVTPSFYSFDEDFTEADLIVSSLGEPDLSGFRIIKNNNKLNPDINCITIPSLRKVLE